MSIQVKGVVVIDDSANVTSVGSISTTTAVIHANGVIQNVQMRDVPIANDAVTVQYIPAYAAYDGSN